LTLKCNKLLSSFAFKFKLCRYIKAAGLSEVSAAVVTGSDIIISVEPPPPPLTASSPPPPNTSFASAPDRRLNTAPPAGFIALLVVGFCIVAVAVYARYLHKDEFTFSGLAAGTDTRPFFGST